LGVPRVAQGLGLNLVGQAASFDVHARITVPYITLAPSSI
jgi:hypothetical protein